MTNEADPKLYSYLPYNRRPKITWPNSARIALWVAPNIEFYELDPPPNPKRQPWARPLPDVLAYSHRDYGNRAGWQRMMDAMDAVGIRGSVSLNVAMCEHHPQIIEECGKRGWEFYSHGIYNTRYTYGMSMEQEREIVLDSIETVRRWSGQTISGWLSPALSNNVWTMDLLAAAGIRYTCDLFHDDQPMPVAVKTGKLISIPYSLELNDVIAYLTNQCPPRHYGETIERQFDQLHAEGARSGTVMCIPLHPYLLGQPHRIQPFAEALEYIVKHEGVWLATGREIAEHYYANYYDQMLAAGAQQQSEVQS